MTRRDGAVRRRAEQSRHTGRRRTVPGVMRVSRGKGGWPAAEMKGLVGLTEGCRVYPADRRLGKLLPGLLHASSCPGTASCDDLGTLSAECTAAPRGSGYPAASATVIGGLTGSTQPWRTERMDLPIRRGYQNYRIQAFHPKRIYFWTQMSLYLALHTVAK